MGGSLTPELKRLLAAAGCTFERPGKGDHEIWYSPITKRRFPVDHEILSRPSSTMQREEGTNRTSARPPGSPSPGQGEGRGGGRKLRPCIAAGSDRGLSPLAGLSNSIRARI